MKLTTIENLMEEWAKDSIIEPGPDTSTIGLKEAKLHSKYSNWLINHNLLVRKLGFDIADLKAKKFLYYTGKLPDDELLELGWPKYYNAQFKADVGPYIDTDKDLIALNMKKIMHEEIVEFCKSIIKQNGSKTWQVRNYVEQEKFLRGA